MLDKQQEAKIFKTLIVNKEIQSKLEGDNGKYLSELKTTGDYYDGFMDKTSPEALDYRTSLLLAHLDQLRETYEANERVYNITALEFATKTDEIQEGILKSERLVCDLNKEIVKQRIQFEQYEFELQNENEILRRQNVEIASKLASLESNLDEERREIARSIEKLANQQSAKFKAKCRSKEEEAEKVKREYHQLQKAFGEKVKAMEQEMIELKQK